MITEFPHFLFFLRGQHDNHAFTFKNRHLFHFTVIFEIVGKTQQQYLTLLFEKDRPAFEKDVCFYFCPFFEESFCMFELEVIIVVVGLRSETYLLDNNLCRFSFLLFKAFFLLVEKLLVIDDAANGRYGIGEISTKSRPCSSAIRRASCVEYTPCSTFSPTRRTSRARILSFIEYWFTPSFLGGMLRLLLFPASLFFSIQLPLVYHILDLFGENFGKGSNFHRTFITFTLFSYRNFFILFFFFSDNKQIRNSFELIIRVFSARFFHYGHLQWYVYPAFRVVQQLHVHSHYISH